MGKDILYLGDTALTGAASYLAGVMSHFGITFDYRPSDAQIETGLLEGRHRAIVLSDYPSANFRAGQLERLARGVRDGTGLLMIGGWESFHGAGGDYSSTVLKEVLPVVMQSSDDRVNCAQPCLVEKNQSHPIVEGLPFEAASPCIGGYNRVAVKPEGEEVLSARRFRVQRGPAGHAFTPADKADPLLVTGSYGRGRVVAFASDVAPHWVGGLVDWGESRVSACADGASPVEVGDRYAKLFSQMVRWAAGMD